MNAPSGEMPEPLRFGDEQFERWPAPQQLISGSTKFSGRRYMCVRQQVHCPRPELGRSRNERRHDWVLALAFMRESRSDIRPEMLTMAKSATPAEMLRVLAYAASYATAWAQKMALRVTSAACTAAAEDGLRRFIFDSRFHSSSAERAKAASIRRETYQQLCAAVFEMLNTKHLEATLLIARILHDESIDRVLAGVGEQPDLVKWKYPRENISRDSFATESAWANPMKLDCEDIANAA